MFAFGRVVAWLVYAITFFNTLMNTDYGYKINGENSGIFEYKACKT